MKKILFAISLLLVTSSSFAAPAWYSGTINRLWTHAADGGFIITFEGTSSLANCKHKYVYFTSQKMQLALLNSSLSVALSAFHTNTKVGVVIDKTGDGEYCYASSIDIRR